jgi:hypothetical protein
LLPLFLSAVFPFFFAVRSGDPFRPSNRRIMVV